MMRSFLLAFGLLGAGEASAMPYEDFIKEPPKAEASAHPTIHQGTITELQHAAGYSYLKLQTEAGPEWAAIRDMALKVGDRVAYSDPLIMDNFYSKTLKQNFKRILFISKIKKMRADALPSAE